MATTYANLLTNASFEFVILGRKILLHGTCERYVSTFLISATKDGNFTSLVYPRGPVKAISYCPVLLQEEPKLN